MRKGTVAVLSAIAGAVVGAVGSGYLGSKQVEQKAGKVDKFKGYYNILNQWLILKQEGRSLAEYFEANHYSTVAIYGMGEMGNRLYEELKDSNIKIQYSVDQNAESTYSELEVIDPEGDFAPVDAMVVTATFAFDEIEKELSQKVEFPIISLEDVVYEI